MPMKSGDGLIVRIRGFPWDTTTEQLKDFFDDVNIINGEEGIHIVVSDDGKPSGEAFMNVESQDDVDAALKKDGKYLGKRYVEIFECTQEEMDAYVRRFKAGGGRASDAWEDAVVRLRGLPYNCSKEEVAQFFAGMQIVPNGILIPDAMDGGRGAGDAFVRFKSPDLAERALSKNRETIGTRYIEVFPSSVKEAQSFSHFRAIKGAGNMHGGRPSPYGIPPSRFLNSGMARARGYGGDYGGGMSDRPMSLMSERSMGSMGGGRRGGDFGGGMKGGDFGGGYDRYSGGGGGRDRGFDDSRGGGHVVQMRGLPYKAMTQDVIDFFRPLVPINAQIIYDGRGKVTGEAKAEFASHDEAVKAMCKDRSSMGTRYIELYLDSTPGGGGRSGGGGGSNGFGSNIYGTAAFRSGGGFGGGMSGGYGRAGSAFDF